jgi:hypothetical protein
MIRLVPQLERLPEGSPRLWLVFFGNNDGCAWWARLCRPGFRHVSAAAYYADRERWVYFNPARRGTVIEIYEGDEFDVRLGYLMQESAAVLRVQSRFGRTSTPALWHCVGAIKALLGVRSCALCPKGLHDHLRAIGAEPVEVPSRVKPVRGRIDPAASAGGSGDQADARPRAAAC